MFKNILELHRYGEEMERDRKFSHTEAVSSFFDSFPDRKPLYEFSLSEFLAEPIEPQRFVISGAAPRGDVSIFAGQSGIGKSLFMLQAAVCVASGRPFFGQPVEIGSAVALLWEDTKAVLRGRIENVLAATGINEGDLGGRLILEPRDQLSSMRYVLWQDGRPTAAYHVICSELARIKDLSLLVIDTSKVIFQGDLANAEQVRPFVHEMRDLSARLGVATVLVTHLNRAGDTSGSIEWTNNSRSVFHLVQKREHYVYEHVKANYGPRFSPVLIELSPTGVWVQASEVATQPSRREAAPAARLSRLERAREVFLRCLDECTQPLSIKKHSPLRNYAPRVFADTVLAKRARVAQADLEAALSALLEDGSIHEVETPGKHKTRVLARTPPVEGQE